MHQVQAPTPMGKHIWIVEIGYCAATWYHDKWNEKQQQHAPLKSLLESLNYIVDILPMLLGNTGEIFQDKKITSFQPAWLIRCSTPH